MVVSLNLLPERKCDTCTAFDKKLWGCTRKAITPVNIMGIDMLRCPNRPLLDDPAHYNELFNIVGWVKEGFLPDEGTYLDQPNKLVESLAVINYTHKLIQKHVDERNK